MSRTTRPQIEALAEQVKRRMADRDIPGTAFLHVDRATAYGGYCLSFGGSSLGEAFMDANRIPAGDFYRALRMLRDLLERLPEESSGGMAHLLRFGEATGNSWPLEMFRQLTGDGGEEDPHEGFGYLECGILGAALVEYARQGPTGWRAAQNSVTD